VCVCGHANHYTDPRYNNQKKGGRSTCTHTQEEKRESSSVKSRGKSNNKMADTITKPDSSVGDATMTDINNNSSETDNIVLEVADKSHITISRKIAAMMTTVENALDGFFDAFLSTHIIYIQATGGRADEPDKSITVPIVRVSNKCATQIVAYCQHRLLRIEKAISDGTTFTKTGYDGCPVNHDLDQWEYELLKNMTGVELVEFAEVLKNYFQ